MRCSVSPLLRASVVCMLMQLAQPLICEARIFTSSIRLGSRLAAIASEAPVQTFMTSGAAVRRLTLAVIGPLLSLGSDDMTSRGPSIVTSPRNNLRRSDLSAIAATTASEWASFRLFVARHTAAASTCEYDCEHGISSLAEKLAASTL